MNSHVGKMRNIYGELQQQKFEDIYSSEVTSDGYLIDANDKYLCVNLILNFYFFKLFSN